MRPSRVWMTVLLGLNLAGLCLAQSGPSAETQWWADTALVKVMRQSPPGPSRRIRLAAARGTTEWAQLDFRAPRATSVTFAAAALSTYDGACLPTACIVFHPAVYMHVSHPAGNRVHEPADWPEVLPVGDSCQLPANMDQAVYVEFRIPSATPPGLYGGCLTFTLAGRQPVRVPVRLIVWPITVPRTPTVRASYYVWWQGIEKHYHLTPGTPATRRVLNRFFTFALDHRLCPMSLPVDIHQAAPYMADPRVNAVRLPYTGTDQQMAETINFVKRHGWLNRCYYYLNDEPPRRIWPQVWAAANRLRRFDPLTPRLDTIQPVAGLAGAVTIWCPNVEAVDLHEAAIAAARARGEQVWWYTCVVPQYPYPTFLLDDDAIAPRLLFWSQPRYNLTGSLYINTIYWAPEGHDTWREAVTSMPQLGNNNDGLLIYSGRTQPYPVTGVRLEMIRDGLQDVELCNLLARQIVSAARQLGRDDGEAVAQQHLAALASHVVPDLRHCDRSPDNLLYWRSRVAHEIIELREDPRCLATLLKLPIRTVPPDDRKVAEDKFAVALPGTPVIDGELDDQAWRQAREGNGPGSRTVITRFRNLTGLIWPSELTTVMLLHDHDNLYVSFNCREPQTGGLRFMAEEHKLDKVDRVAVALADGGRSRWFTVTADGAMFEGDLAHPRPARAGLWEAKTRLDPGGYTVEFRFARSLTGGAAQPLFNLFRYSPAGGETLYFVGRFADRQNPFQLGTLTLRQ